MCTVCGSRQLRSVTMGGFRAPRSTVARRYSTETAIGLPIQEDADVVEEISEIRRCDEADERADERAGTA